MASRRPPAKLKKHCTAEQWRFATQPDYARKVIFARDGAICCECDEDATADWHLDHVVPLHLCVGDDITHWLPGNAQTLCARCHHRKSGREASVRGHDQRLQRERRGEPKRAGWRRKVDGTVVFDGKKPLPF